MRTRTRTTHHVHMDGRLKVLVTDGNIKDFILSVLLSVHPCIHPSIIGGGGGGCFLLIAEDILRENLYQTMD